MTDGRTSSAKQFNKLKKKAKSQTIGAGRAGGSVEATKQKVVVVVVIIVVCIYVVFVVS